MGGTPALLRGFLGWAEAVSHLEDAEGAEAAVDERPVEWNVAEGPQMRASG